MKTKNKKAAESLAVNKLIVLILALIAVIVVIIFIFKPSIWEFVKNLPGYTYNDSDTLITNFTADELAGLGCSKLVGQIGQASGLFGSKALRFIYIGDLQTSLYYNEKTKEIILRYYASDVKVGVFKDDKIEIYDNFLNEDSVEFIKYTEDIRGSGLPDISEINLLNGAKMIGSLLCKSEDEIGLWKKSRECVETCSLYNGECKDTCSSDEIILSDLDCKENKKCCAKEIEEKLEDNGLSIKKFAFTSTKKDSKTSFVDNNKLITESGIPIVFEFSGEYKEVEKSDKPFCYIIRTNKELKFKKYFEASIRGSDFTGSSILWTPTDEKSFEYVIFEPGTINKAIKRIKVDTQEFEKYKDGSFIANNNFKEKITSLPDGIYYALGIGVDFKYKRIFSSDLDVYISDFSIVKQGESLTIYGYYSEPGKDNKDWYKLDCNIWGIGISIELYQLDDNLKNTLIKSCELN